MVAIDPTFGAQEEAKELMNIMANLDLVYLEAEYRGGHDEGGIDDIVSARTRTGEDVADEHGNWQSELWMAADAVLTCKYYGWALEGYSWGKLFADARTGRVWTEGDDEVPVVKRDEEPIEITVAPADFGNAIDPKAEWRAAVANNETQQGYSDWYRQRERS